MKSQFKKGALIVMAISCAGSLKLKAQQVQQTLDGTSATVAQQKIANFQSHRVRDEGTNKSISVFYPISKLKQIDDLLTEEHTADPVNKSTGIRFYLGCDAPSTGTKVRNVEIYMVSTDEKTPVLPDHPSTHGDNYRHVANRLSPIQIGTLNIDEADALNKGATLYGSQQPLESTCANPSKHFLPDSTAFARVRKRSKLAGKDQSFINTESEWFPYCFIHSVISAMEQNGYSGLRVYLGKGYVPELHTERDVFILVPTKTNTAGLEVDDYHCLEDQQGFTGCPVPQQSGQRLLKSTSGASSEQHLYRINSVNFGTVTGGAPGAGYDEGELCPDVCN
jgi:hypothetical protein